MVSPRICLDWPGWWAPWKKDFCLSKQRPDPQEGICLPTKVPGWWKRLSCLLSRAVLYLLPGAVMKRSPICILYVEDMTSQHIASCFKMFLINYYILAISVLSSLHLLVLIVKVHALPESELFWPTNVGQFKSIEMPLTSQYCER